MGTAENETPACASETRAAELAERDLANVAAGAMPRGPSGTGKTLSAPLLGKLMPEEPVSWLSETEKNIED